MDFVHVAGASKGNEALYTKEHHRPHIDRSGQCPSKTALHDTQKLQWKTVRRSELRRLPPDAPAQPDRRLRDDAPVMEVRLPVTPNFYGNYLVREPMQRDVRLRLQLSPTERLPWFTPPVDDETLESIVDTSARAVLFCQCGD